MSDLALEAVVFVVLAAIGALALYALVWDRVWGIDPYWLYGLGALVVSVPAIIVMERRRRKPF